jgi:hypothetical protein
LDQQPTKHWVTKESRNGGPMYCLIFGLDYRTMPPHLFHNQARLFIFYTVMGYHFHAGKDDNNNIIDLDEERGTFTIVEYSSPPVQYNDDCNRYERQQQLLKIANPPPLQRAQLNDLYLPNEQYLCEESQEEESNGDDKAYSNKNIIDELEQEHQASMPNTNMASEGEDALEQERQASDVSNLIGVANDMVVVVQDQNAPNEHE